MITVTKIALRLSIEEAHRKLTKACIECVHSHAYILKKGKKNKKIKKNKHPPSFHVRSDTPNSWKEKKEKMRL